MNLIWTWTQLATNAQLTKHYFLGQRMLAMMLTELEAEERELHIFRLREVAVMERVHGRPDREQSIRWALRELGEPV